MKFAASISLFIMLFVLTFAVNAKPLPSLSMKMDWENGVAFEQAVKIKLQINSQISSEQVNVKLDLPTGVTLQDGELSLQRKIIKGQPLLLDFIVYIEKNAVGEIKAEASMGDVQQVFFRANSQLIVVNPSASQKIRSRSASPPAYQHTERNGVKLREYRLP